MSGKQYNLEGLLADFATEYDYPVRFMDNVSIPRLQLPRARKKLVDEVVAKIRANYYTHQEVEQIIGPHYPGCPAITKYVGPEGTPYDGPACDCGVLEMCQKLAALKAGKGKK